MSFNRTTGRKIFRKRSCAFCRNKDIVIDYKNVDLLKKFVAESGKIEPRRLTGTCFKHQRWVSAEIKKARNMALLPFVAD